MNRPWPSSNPNIILGCKTSAFVPCIEDPARLDQQQLDLLFGIRLVFDTFRDDEHFARRNADCAITKLDPQNALQHNECLIGFFVIVPNEVPLQPDWPSVRQ
jgi:hypothetical protein